MMGLTEGAVGPSLGKCIGGSYVLLVLGVFIDRPCSQAGEGQLLWTDL